MFNIFFRKFNESELKRLTSSAQKAPLPRPFNSRTISLSRASPSVPTVSLSKAVPIIEASSLSLSGETKDQDIGHGRFSSCSKQVFRDSFVVCVKQLSPNVPLQAIKSEAAILRALNSCEFIPYCFGVCPTNKAVVMEYLSVDDKPINLYSALKFDECGLTFNQGLAVQLSIDVCNGVQCMHGLGYLHNDLKLDNVVLGKSWSRPLKAYIVDFGKACKVDSGKRYTLSSEEKEMYKHQHRQIAPDLRDGLVAQSIHTDVYSLGRIQNKLGKCIIKEDALRTLIKQTLSYYSTNRPSISSVLSALHSLQ